MSSGKECLFWGRTWRYCSFRIDSAGAVELRIVAYGLLAGVFVMTLIGGMQAFGYDFFRTDAGKAVMNLMLDNKLDFTFNFEKGRVYATLYNPNYVGSYVALLLPVILSLVSGKRKTSAVFVSVVSALLLVMLFGSQSLTGCIGVAASLVLFLILMIPNMKKKPLPFVIGGVVCAVVCVFTVFCYQPLFEYGINKMFHPAPNNQVIRSMEGKRRHAQNDDGQWRCAKSESQYCGGRIPL